MTVILFTDAPIMLGVPAYALTRLRNMQQRGKAMKVSSTAALTRELKTFSVGVGGFYTRSLNVEHMASRTTHLVVADEECRGEELT